MVWILTGVGAAVVLGFVLHAVASWLRSLPEDY